MTVTVNGTTGIDVVQPGTVQQADLAANVAGNGPCFSAYKSGANQSVTSGVAAKASLQIEQFDIGGCFNNTASSATLNGLSVPAYAFMPNVAGYYQINATMYGSASPVTSVSGFIYKNGASVAVTSVNGTIAVLTLATLVYLNGTSDYVELFGTVVGTTPVIGFGANDTTLFSGFLARAA